MKGDSYIGSVVNVAELEDQDQQQAQQTAAAHASAGAVWPFHKSLSSSLRLAHSC
jgi:hypothetical protein